MAQTIEDIILAGQRSPGSTLLFDGVRRNPKLPLRADISCVPIFATITGGSYLGALIAPDKLVVAGNRMPEGEVYFLGGEWSEIDTYSAVQPADDGVIVHLKTPIKKCRPCRVAHKSWYTNRTRVKRVTWITGHRSLALGLTVVEDDRRTALLPDRKNRKWWVTPSRELDAGSPVFYLDDDGELVLITCLSDECRGPNLGCIL